MRAFEIRPGLIINLDLVVSLEQHENKIGGDVYLSDNRSFELSNTEFERLNSAIRSNGLTF